MIPAWDGASCVVSSSLNSGRCHKSRVGQLRRPGLSGRSGGRGDFPGVSWDKPNSVFKTAARILPNPGPKLLLS